METKSYLAAAEKMHQAMDALVKEKEHWSSIESAAQALPQDSPEAQQILAQCARQQERLDRLLDMLRNEQRSRP